MILQVEECRSLWELGADVNRHSPEGDTCLLAACRNGHEAVALFLLEHGMSHSPQKWIMRARYFDAWV
jgi:ankyrin repeat protein